MSLHNKKLVPKMTTHEFFADFWKGDKLDVGISIGTVVGVVLVPTLSILYIWHTIQVLFLR